MSTCNYVGLAAAAALVLMSASLPAHATKPKPPAAAASAAVVDSGASAPTGAKLDKLIETYRQCKNLAGELGGDNSRRDREVTQKLLALNCEDVTGSLERAIKVMPANSPKVQEIARLLAS